MLYYLFDWLHKLNFPGAGMFGYTSFRALMAIILALLISSIWGDKFIKLLKRKQITETQRDAKIDPFGVNKVGVPSMGGVIIIVAILIPCLLLGKLHNIYMILMLITTVWLGSLGFADDYIKIFKKDKEGLHGKFKIIGQVGLGLIVGLTLYLSPDVVIRENIEVQTPGREMEVVHGTNDLKSTQTTIPFFKSNNLDYADLVAFMGDHAQTAGWILFVIITIFVVTAVSNGANLNGRFPLGRPEAGEHKIFSYSNGALDEHAIRCKQLQLLILRHVRQLIFQGERPVGKSARVEKALEGKIACLQPFP